MENLKSEVKSYRLNSEMLKVIRKAAGKEGLSENAFVRDLLSRRVKADPLIRAFPYIVLSRRSFVLILGMTNPDGLEMVGLDLGRRNFALARELYDSMGTELGFANYLTDILDEQAHWFETEGANSRHEKMTLRHEYGMKWSLFLKSFLTGAYEVVSHDRMRMKITDAYLSMELPKAPR